MLIENNELINRLTKYNYVSEDYFLVLISQIKNLVKHINYDFDFFNENKLNLDLFNDVENIYGILQLNYKNSTIRNKLGLIIRILEINEYKYIDLIDEYKIYFNRLNSYVKINHSTDI